MSERPQFLGLDAQEYMAVVNAMQVVMRAIGSRGVTAGLWDTLELPNGIAFETDRLVMRNRTKIIVTKDGQYIGENYVDHSRPPFTDEDVDAAVTNFDAWARENAPEFEGILDAKQKGVDES